VRLLLDSWVRRADWALALVALLALGATYFVLAKLGLKLASVHPSASPVWPPSGLALAAFMLWGNRVWPAIAAGAFIANATTFGSIATSAAIAAGNTLEGLVTAMLLERWSSRAEPFETPSRIVAFVCLSLAPGTMISATIGVGSLVLSGSANAQEFASIWLTWWLGDVGGQLLVAPVIVLWWKSGPSSLDRADALNLAALLVATALVGIAAFSPVIEQTAARGALAFLAIFPMLWAALRHNQRDTASAALLLSAFAIWGTLGNGGPFARPNLNDSFLLVMAFCISVAVPSLVLSADVATRRISEEQHRVLVENAEDIIATLDLEMRFTSVSPAIERLLGYSRGELIGAPLGQFVAENQFATHKEMLARKLAGQTPSTQYEVTIRAKDGRLLTLELKTRLLSDAKGRPTGIHGIARDVTERKDAEARQILLVRELQHRTKNLLAVVQSIVNNTLATTGDAASAREAIMGRLQALARAQEFVVSGAGGGVELRKLIEAEVSAFSTQMCIEGIPVVVGGSFAQNIALVVHELVTNAIKYGSLSRSSGRVHIRWQVETPAEGPILKFSWTERGGPPAKPAEEQGFGTDLIFVALGDGARLSFGELGLELEADIPMHALVSDDGK
jgi:PAS domain S-box-containing protein